MNYTKLLKNLNAYEKQGGSDFIKAFVDNEITDRWLENFNKEEIDWNEIEGINRTQEDLV